MSHNKNKLSECSNCGYKFTGADNFCPDCGQENHDIRLPLKHHIHEVIEGLLHFDSKSMRTFFYLMIRPGMLSKEFNGGKRVRFVPPVRLYVFISFLFFFLLSTGKIIHKESNKENKESFAITFFSSSLDSRVTSEEKSKLTLQQVDSLNKYRSQVTPGEVAGLNNNQIDSVIADKKIDNSAVNRYIFRQVAKAGNEGSVHLFKLVQRNVSYGMFVLMPFIGMFFYIFYRKKSGYYVENLVISIHYHCVIFLVFSFVLFVDKFIDFGTGYLAAILLVPVYLYFMLKKYYEQKVFITLIKTFAIGFIQLISTVLFYFLISIITIGLL